MNGTTAEGSSEDYPRPMYLCFEGVRRPERLLKVLLGITGCDIQCAPGFLAVAVRRPADVECILGDPEIIGMDDSPEGFWVSELLDSDGFLDKVEGSSRHYHRKIHR